MRRPRNYALNKAWTMFRLNEAPVETGRGGDFAVV